MKHGWSETLTEKTREMLDNMNAYGAFFKCTSGERGVLMPKDYGLEITIFAESKGFSFPPPLSDKKYFFKDTEDLIKAGWAVD